MKDFINEVVSDFNNTTKSNTDVAGSMASPDRFYFWYIYLFTP